MFTIKNFFHDLAIAIARVFMKLLPDKIPVTFIGPDASRELCESIAHISTDPSSTKILIVTDATRLANLIVDDQGTGLLMAPRQMNRKLARSRAEVGNPHAGLEFQAHGLRLDEIPVGRP